MLRISGSRQAGEEEVQVGGSGTCSVSKAGVMVVFYIGTWHMLLAVVRKHAHGTVLLPIILLPPTAHSHSLLCRVHVQPACWFKSSVT